MRLWEELKDARIEARMEGRMEGRIEGHEAAILESIKNLIESTDWPVEQAMDILKVTETERDKYLNLLEK